VWNVCFNKGIIFHPYNEDFKRYHQIALSILKQFGFGRNILETRISVEVKGLINKIKKFNGQPFDPKEACLQSVQSIISRIIFGQPIDPADDVDKRFMEITLKWAEQVMNLLILDYLPLLRFISYFRRQRREAAVLTAELFELLDKKIDKCLKVESGKNFVSCYVQKLGSNFDRAQLKITLRDLVFAGSETVSSTTMWAMVLLANNPDVQRRLQKEIDCFVPRDRLPSLSDFPKMTYLEATILELMRCKTVTPIGVVRSTLCDTQVGGYFIPKNSQVNKKN